MASGTIIILNGTSSSGKTSLLKVLQNQLPEPYLDAGIDKFIWMLPERYLDRPLWDDVLGLADRAGASGHQLVRSMHRSIAAIARSGSNVIADHVLVEPGWVDDLAQVLAGLPVLLVGVRCPLEVLETREKARRNRTLGQARLQFDKVHAQCVYDLEVDTACFSAEECARQIKVHLDQHGPGTALAVLVKKSGEGRRQLFTANDVDEDGFPI